jgi:hypothetical protein
MTQLHSIAFERVNVNGLSYVQGTNEYHILYLVHSKKIPGLFEIKKQNPFLKETTTSILFDYPTRIVGYSTDVPIVISFKNIDPDPRQSILLMPNYRGQNPLMLSDDLNAVLPFQEIIGFTTRTMQFSEFSGELPEKTKVVNSP